MDFNSFIVAGNLTRDIEIHYAQGGIAIAKTGIATNRHYKSQTGEPKTEVMFIDLVFFGRTAEIANQYLQKGANILVQGRIVFEQWTAQDGSKRSKHVVHVETLQMGNKPNEEQGQPQQQQQQQQGNNQNQNYQQNRGNQNQNHRQQHNNQNYGHNGNQGGNYQQPNYVYDEEEIPV
ncbi:MAG: single-stranded DNA-binding protein [Epsilonproteobacteria bacterium]|nr:single-stranded DNA-binding protein [Campylobacterota bacterium]